ncbi:hypothetical protein [Roseimicrobium sp. ORNL1]|uniref:DUF4760 domain-containing protein n=1 Tax=Roseimicrobium sp. ORNL1 TaxID=2711231 RepID=UPI0013E1195A|nr:hypothetical protein [Roseimicrobium sp. ORNL1]QIF02387.1 hypothetical protein G5S37_12920 [Roseimicrobium sp. ORNL1]
MKATRLQLILILCAIASGGLFCLLKFGYHESVKDSVSSAGVVFTASGLFFAAYSLSENHRWNRYQYTLEMMAEWNNQVRSHLDVIFSNFPALYQIPDNLNLSQWKIDEGRAKEINTATSQSQDATIRNSILTTMNFFEAMARAYEIGAVERDTVRESFGPMMLDLWHYFGPFVVVAGRSDHRDPWPPLRRVCNLWNAEYLRAVAAEAAKAADARCREAQGGSKTRPQTGS